MGGGTVLFAVGMLIVVVAAIVAMFAMAGVSLPGILIAAAILAVGGATTVAGGAMIGAGIDPPVLRHEVRAVEPPRRRVSISADAPVELVSLVRNIYEVEHLCTGELDLVDLARGG